MVALQDAAHHHGAPLDRVHLHCSSAAESRADRLALGRGEAGVPVRVHVVARGRNLTGIAIVLGIADTWHERPDAGLLIVSGDGDLAFAAAHYAARDPGKRPVELLHPGQTAPAVPGARRPVAHPLGLRLTPSLQRRPWTAWDQAAWTLRQLATHASSRVAASLLDGWEASWPATRDPSAADWARLERADDLVAALWRLAQGRPVTWDDALAEAASRLRGQAHAWQHEARSALLALWTAGLLRDTGTGALEVPSGWREGLLLPARRLVLHLDRRTPAVQSVANLRRLHRGHFYRAPGGDDWSRRLERVSSADSWDWVARALRERLHAVAEDTQRRAHDGHGFAVWRLRRDSGFVARTLRTAREVRAALTTPLATAVAEARLVARGIHAPKRWLRCMRDAGVVAWDPRSETWSAPGGDAARW